jgi:hypothetical protein
MVDKTQAVDVAKEIASNTDSVEHDRERSSGAHDFKYNGAVHAHRLPDDFRIVGFGSGWFAIDKE